MTPRFAAARPDAMTSITWDNIHRSLERLNADWSLGLDSRQLALCVRHLELVRAWNRTHNLTRISTAQDTLAKHVADSLIPAKWLPEAARVLDIGSGPGFPAVPLKILHPSWSCVLLEKSRKKVSFLKVVIASLDLTAIRARHQRWETFRESPGQGSTGGFDLITMRGIRIDRQMLARLAQQLLRPGGSVAHWSGPAAPEAASSAQSAPLPRSAGFAPPTIRSYHLPFAAGQRRLVVWRLEHGDPARPLPTMAPWPG